MTRLAIAFLAAAAALVLSGCGIRGDLERPPPIWLADAHVEAGAPDRVSSGAEAEGAALRP